ncbi:MAG: hypothetical protein WDN26_22985 [Chitinophagaceae bacterium]
MFYGNATFCQQPLIARFNSYNSIAVQEKLFLHTDKEFYIAGEILWFRIYYVDGATHRPLHLSKVAYVEIINEKNEPVSQAKISLQPGDSKGSFYLPTLLNTGNYTIRAYTNWMKNFDDGYFFQKKITIVNTLKAPEATSSRQSDPDIAVSFFPEGGNLVSSLESKVGFIVANAEGGINDFQGFIISNSGDTITRFSPLKFGIGSFVFKPLPGYTYKAIILLSRGAIINKPLPVIYDNGYVMQVRDNNEGKIEIKVQRKKMQGEDNAEQVLLAAHTRQVLNLAEKISINDNGSAIFLVDKNKIGKGITHFTLFNSDNKPLCERLIYIKPGPGISVNVKSDQTSYTNRQQINLSLSTQFNQPGSTPLHLSASVFKIDSLQKHDESTIVDYMWLTSDIAGKVESPSYYFSNDPDINVATDNLMLTHGWRRFKWNDILAGGNGFIKYLPEAGGQLVQGRLKDKDDKPVANTDAYLSIPGQPFGFYISRSDNNGGVQFEVKDYYGNRQVIVQPGIETDTLYKVEIIKPFLEADTGRKYATYQLPEDNKEQLLQKSIAMQVQNIYSGDSMRNFAAPVLIDTLPFYGYPEKQYQLDLYKRFTTMEEILREYVVEINVVNRGGKLALKIFNPDASDFYTGYALVLLDGVPLPDVNKIFSYDPLKVKKLEVIQARYVMGQSIFNGVASFSTYEGVFDGFELDPKLVAIDYPGLQLERDFYSPVYETKAQIESRLPDFRNTLLWAPDITTDKEGKARLQFYSSDRVGKYIVVLQGMNESGDFVSSTSTIEVK